MKNQVISTPTPFFMVHLETENHLGPDVWVDAVSNRRFFKDPDKYPWIADQMAHADKLLDITFQVEEDLHWQSQEYRLDLALDYIDALMPNQG